MQKLTITQIIQKIKNQEVFHAIAENYSFTLKIDSYVHYVCGAVHDGHQFKKSLWDNCLHSEYDRWFEEDPNTKEMIQSHPIVIAGCDSRFEYDLNRSPDSAIYKDAWGKQLWETPIPAFEKEKSLQKHTNFYKVVEALITKLEELHDKVIVYDMHSYNWKRWNREVPTFNIGAGKIDIERFGNDVELWRASLSEIKLPNTIKSTSLINDAFKGNGYFLHFITNISKNTLVLATEVKKIYCNELEQVIFPEVVYTIEKELKKRIIEHASNFIKNNN